MIKVDLKLLKTIVCFMLSYMYTHGSVQKRCFGLFFQEGERNTDKNTEYNVFTNKLLIASLVVPFNKYQTMQAFLRNREIDNIYSINIISKTIFFGFAFLLYT